MSHKRMKNEKRIAVPGIQTEIWLDYIEGEIDKSFQEDLDLILANHPQEREKVESLKQIKAELKKGECELPPDAVFNDLKSLIMAEVVQTKIEPLRVSPADQGHFKSEKPHLWATSALRR